jgi:hypothetical protein
MVDWVVSAPAGTMHWLTPETAKRYGIDYQVLTPERAPQPPPSTQKRDAQIHKQVQVIEDLQLREQPDPRARNIWARRRTTKCRRDRRLPSSTPAEHGSVRAEVRRTPTTSGARCSTRATAAGRTHTSLRTTVNASLA